MKDYRVSIKYKSGEQTATISTTVPAYNERQAIEKIVSANSLDGKVVSKKVELLKID
jgi:hypothetical protein